MNIRPMEQRDVAKLEEIYAKSPMKYDIPMLDSQNLLSALVMVDEKDEPHVMLAAERVAEMFLIMDHQWETPAYRAIALQNLHLEVGPRLRGMGIRSAYAFLGPDVPKGYDRRLYRLGAREMIWRCVKWIAGGS